MNDDIASFERKLATTLNSIADRNQTDRISANDVRTWTGEYLLDHAEEMERFPELKEETHWNLFARDSVDEDALFVLLTFALTEFGVLVGRGSRADVHDFGLNFVGDAQTAIDGVRNRFPHLSDLIAMPLFHGYHWADSV